jgi:hypothetical protein
MKLLNFIFILLLFVIPGDAATSQVRTYDTNYDYLFTQDDLGTINDQIISILDTNISVKISGISGITFSCSKGYKTIGVPYSGQHNFRIYKVLNDGNSLYYLIASYPVNYSVCKDYGQKISLNFASDIEFEESSRYAIGYYYTTSETSVFPDIWMSSFSNPTYKLAWVNTVLNSCNELYSECNILSPQKIVDAGGDDYYRIGKDVNGAEQNRKITNVVYQLLGYKRFPAFNPPAEPSEPGVSNITMPDNPLPTPTPFEISMPDLENLTPCENCNGNESISTGNTFGAGTGISQSLAAAGYCDGDGCTTKDIIDVLYDFSVLGLVLSFLMFAMKLMRVKA